LRLRHCPTTQATACALPGCCSLPHPQTPGFPFKTDKRDSRTIARLLRAGELTVVYIPEPTDEAIRDLCRARTDAIDDMRRCRLRLKAFLLRHGYRYQGKANWSQPHMRYLRELVLPHPAMKAILEEYLQGIDAAHGRVERIEASMLTLLQTWRLKPAVQALMAFRGFQLVYSAVRSVIGFRPATQRASRADMR
jgi:transposase